MFQQIKHIIKEQPRELVVRNFDKQIFKASQYQQDLEENGFVLLKNIVDIEIINQLRAYYFKLSQHPNFEQTDYYFNTISFQDKSIRSETIKNTYEITKKVIEDIFLIEQIELPLGGSYCISPAHATRGCGAHQDPCLVDETKSFSLTLWIPLQATTPINGCLHFIPKSHLWGNFYRSMSMTWAFDDYFNFFEKIIQPQPTELGDALCFDTSVIHSSTANNSEALRLAVNFPIIPKGTPLKSFYPEKEKFKYLQIADYTIDNNYFLLESQYEKPSNQYAKENIIKFNNYFSKYNINKLLLLSGIKNQIV